MTDYWFVGIDGALTKSGVVALGVGKVPYDETVITTKSDPLLEPRLHHIRVHYNEFVAGLLKYKRMPIVVAIETKFVGANAKQYGVLSKVDGIFSLASYDYSAEGIFHVAPAKLKKFVCGTSYLIKKVDVKEAVYKLWDYERTSTDLVDAYALAHYARCVMLGTNGGYRGWQVDVVAAHAQSQVSALLG